MPKTSEDCVLSGVDVEADFSSSRVTFYNFRFSQKSKKMLHRATSLMFSLVLIFIEIMISFKIIVNSSEKSCSRC